MPIVHPCSLLLENKAFLLQKEKQNIMKTKLLTLLMLFGLFSPLSVYGDNVYKNDERQLILKYCDVLVDGRFKEELKDVTLPWRGSSNQRVIDVQKSLKEGKVILHCK